MKFDATMINKAYGLKDDDSDAYRALFQNIDYEILMRALTKGKSHWKSNYTEADNQIGLLYAEGIHRLQEE